MKYSLYLFIFWFSKNIICHHQKATPVNRHHPVKEALILRVLKKIKIEIKEEVELHQMTKKEDHHLRIAVKALEKIMTQYQNQLNFS